MKQYIGTKIIKAEPAVRIDGKVYPESGPIPLSDHEEEGYKVVYADGYESWSPKDVFEEAYRPCDNLTFGLAIEAMNKGKKVARKGWNGKGMFIYIQDGTRCDTEDLRCSAVRDYCKSRVIQHVQINPHIDMKAADGSLVIGWTPSQIDMLAEDWIIVE